MPCFKTRQNTKNEINYEKMQKKYLYQNGLVSRNIIKYIKHNSEAKKII